MKIGIYSCAEREFSIANKTTSGANPFDPFESLDHIKNLKDQCDYVIVLYHGGKEQYRYPSPYLQKVCRKISEKGADLVVCQHSHCIGCIEEYNGSTIVYGQGNFIFNRYDNEFWNNGLLIKLSIKDKVEIEYIPIERNDKGISLPEQEVSKKILEDFYKRSTDILQEGFVQEQYEKVAKDSINNYLSIFAGMNKYLSRIDRILFNGSILKRRYNKRKLLTIKNCIRCKAHSELILEGLKIKANELKDK